MTGPVTGLMQSYASTELGYLGIDATNHDTGIEASSVVGFDDLASHNFCGADRAVKCLRRSHE